MVLQQVLIFLGMPLVASFMLLAPSPCCAQQDNPTDPSAILQKNAALRADNKAAADDARAARQAAAAAKNKARRDAWIEALNVR